nr:hypothetical protein mgb_00001 [uncultured bacterium]
MQAVRQQRLQAIPHPLPPAHQAGRVQRQLMLQVLVAAEVLPVRVLQPARHHALVALVERVLQIVQPHQQTRRQRRLPRPRTVLHVDLRFQAQPVHLPGQAHQRVAEVEDLRQLGAEQVRGMIGLFRHHGLQGIGENPLFPCARSYQKSTFKSIKSIC